MNGLPRGGMRPGDAEDWFRTRRPYFLCRLLRESFQVFARFRAMYTAYAAGSMLDAAAINGLVGTESGKGRLWELKDLCHRLWRETDRQDLHGCLFDWMIGSFFHEAMKLKENLYLRDRYAPVLGQGSAREEGHTGGLPLSGDAFRRYLKEAERDAARQMENLAFLQGQANYLLRLIAAEQVENALFLRELCEHAEAVEDFWGESLEALFADLFPGTPEAGFLLAGRSYLDGHWHDRALAAFSQALAIHPDNSEARRQIHQMRRLTQTLGG